MSALLRRHRTPRYIYNRARQYFYERGHPHDPWLTPAAIDLLGSLLLPADRGAEFGSGRSTTWLAGRVAELTSVEHDAKWYDVVSAQLKEHDLSNVEYVLVPEDQPPERGGDSTYARTALDFPDASLDFALIDGHYRDYCAKFMLPNIKAGGMLIIDNAERYLPCKSPSPGSRTAKSHPMTTAWSEVWAEVTRWRTIWTSSGVWDTAIFIKPGDR